MPYKCPARRKQYKKDWSWRYSQKVRTLVAEFRKNGCLVCGEDDHDCLCAHHRDPEDKRFSVSTLRKSGMSFEKVKKELKKCDCLCLNCHAKLHATLRRKDGREKL